MKKILLILLLLSSTGFSGQGNGFLTKKILNSGLKQIISGFVEQNPKAELFGLFFIKYSHDTTSYLLVTLPPKREAIYNNKPDEVIKLKNRYVLINLGFSNLYEFDSLKYKRIIKNLEQENFQFIDGASTFSQRGIIINVVNGKCSTSENGWTVLDIPTIKMREDSTNGEYNPTIEELKQNPGSVHYKP